MGAKLSSGLNPKQELFCKLYASDREFFGNGVQAYIEAYKPDIKKKGWYKLACQSASQLLSNIKVCEHITKLLDVNGLNDTHVDKQLYLVLTQDNDMNAKTRAIGEYNKLKQRITEKIDHSGTVNFIPILGGASTKESQDDNKAEQPGSDSQG